MMFDLGVEKDTVNGSSSPTYCILRTGIAKEGSGAFSLVYGVREVLGGKDELPSPLVGCWVSGFVHRF